jgi:hypothetical protein
VAAQNHVFKAVPAFWRAFKSLTPDQQKLAQEAFKKFESNPFDPSLKTHKINRLSSLLRRPVFSVSIASDLRSTFTIVGNQIISLDIGTHDIYK